MSSFPIHFRGFIYNMLERSVLSLMLLVANLAITKLYKKTEKMTEIMAHGYSSESTPRELSNEYQHDRV